jgi:hypothetical protein
MSTGFIDRLYLSIDGEKPRLCITMSKNDLIYVIINVIEEHKNLKSYERFSYEIRLQNMTKNDICEHIKKWLENNKIL